MSTQPPIGWEMRTGTWNDDASYDKLSAHAQWGANTVLLHVPEGELFSPSLISSTYITVKPAAAYQVLAGAFISTQNKQLDIHVEWYNTDKNLIGDSLFTVENGSNNVTNMEVAKSFRAPDTARFCKIWFQAVDPTGLGNIDVWVDHVLIDVAPIAFKIGIWQDYTVSDNANVAFALNFDEVKWDHGINTNVVTGTFRAPQNGVYLFKTSLSATIATANCTGGFVYLNVDGSPADEKFMRPTSTGDAVYDDWVTFLELRAGDVVTLQVSFSGVSSSDDVVIKSDYTYWAGTLID